MYSPIVIRSSPGIKRDGTVFEGDNYIDAQWCRFYRGLPRKIGGYRTINKFLPEIGQGMISYTQNTITHVHVGSANLLSYFQLDALGNASVIYNRTPVSLLRNPSNQWRFDILTDSSQVPPVNQIVAQVAPNIDCVCNSFGGQVFIGPLIGTGPLTEITSIAGNFVSATGGVVALNPYLFVYGNDGSIGWSAPGRPAVFDTFEATNFVSAYTTSDVTPANSTGFRVAGDARTSFAIGEFVRLNGSTSSPASLTLAGAITTSATTLIFNGDLTTLLAIGDSISVGTSNVAVITGVGVVGGKTNATVAPAIIGSFPIGTQCSLIIPDSAFFRIVLTEYVSTPAPGFTNVVVEAFPLAPPPAPPPIIYDYPAGNAITLQTQTLTGAGSVRAASQKIVRGIPLRGGGGNSPAGIFWSADAVVRCNFVGGDLVFSFDTLSVNSSIISPASVIEQDGVYYWIGSDRFLMFNGVVRELPNNMNLNWFFDNINRLYETKVYAWRVPRFGEIWWAFPFGTATECTHAIIYNIREQTWYDTILPNGGRSSAEFSPVIARPLACGVDQNDFFNSVGVIGFFALAGGDKVTALGDLTAVLSPGDYITFRNNTILGFLQILTVTLDKGNTDIVFTTPLLFDIPIGNYIYRYTTGFNFWQHEYGVNEYGASAQQPILSYFETSDISLTTQNPPKNKLLSVSMVEPDFVQKGDMQVQITGSANARSINEISDPQTIYERPSDAQAQVIYFKTERRLLRFKFTSNVIDGDYQMGQVLAHISESDGRYLGGVK